MKIGCSPKLKSRKQISAVAENNIHKSLRFIFVIAQVFGFFPIQNVLATNPESVGFSWLSLRVLSATLTYSMGILMTLAHVRKLVVLGYDQFEMNGAMFYICGSLSCIFFIKMAKDWQSIVLKWEEVDTAMASYGWPKKLNRRLKTIAIICLLLEAAGHICIQANKLTVAIQCKGSLSKGFEHFIVNMSFPEVFTVIQPYYSHWLGIIIQVFNTRMAFSWTFIDLFIILISYALASRFRQINSKFRWLKDMKDQSERNWAVVSEDYNRLCSLCALLDEKMSFLILISFFTNFYYIIFHVFGSLTLHSATTLEAVYGFISFFLLLMRLISVCLFGSWIHEESKKPVAVVFSLPFTISNKEFERLVDSLRYRNVGLTGRRFFRITRNLILKIASAVVTSELVVIQFNRNFKKTDTHSQNSVC